MSDLPDFDRLVQPIGQHLSGLFDAASDALAEDDEPAVAAAISEIGRVVGTIACRMYAYENLLEKLAEADESVRAELARMMNATPLPESVPTYLPAEWA